MQYTIESHSSFLAIGIDVVTANAEGRASRDIGELWGRFFSEGVPDRIPNRVDSEETMTIYTDYESDQDGPYRAVVGCRVSSLEEIPEGMVGLEIEGGRYARYRAEGIPPQNIVETWMKIWEEKGYQRRYGADFDIFTAASFDEDEPVSYVFVSVA